MNTYLTSHPKVLLNFHWVQILILAVKWFWWVCKRKKSRTAHFLSFFFLQLFFLKVPLKVTHPLWFPFQGAIIKRKNRHFQVLSDSLITSSLKPTSLLLLSHYRQNKFLESFDKTFKGHFEGSILILLQFTHFSFYFSLPPPPLSLSLANLLAKVQININFLK